ncbi:MAG: hypothetical protein Q4F88_07075 [Eubacteriales bacterium]|nr:hypothetical protein [Eubacteriales bacterium]
MSACVNLYSNKDNEIYKFLQKTYTNTFFVKLYLASPNKLLRFFSKNMFNKLTKIYSRRNRVLFYDKKILEWKKEFKNPIEIANIIGVYIENKDDYLINMWISLDENIFININKYNADNIIKYLYERYPY